MTTTDKHVPNLGQSSLVEAEKSTVNDWLQSCALCIFDIFILGHVEEAQQVIDRAAIWVNGLGSCLVPCSAYVLFR